MLLKLYFFRDVFVSSATARLLAPSAVLPPTSCRRPGIVLPRSLLQARLYRLHPCNRPASMQSSVLKPSCIIHTLRFSARCFLDLMYMEVLYVGFAYSAYCWCRSKNRPQKNHIFKNILNSQDFL